jgi:hypothetical protein
VILVFYNLATGPYTPDANQDANTAAVFSDSIAFTALGNQTVNNYGYAGSSAFAALLNLKNVTRHYKFGARCTLPSEGNAACNTTSSVTIGGAAATIVSWE